MKLLEDGFMDVRSVSGQVNVARLTSVRKNSGRISLPVSRSQGPYAQFKYVRGVPMNSRGAGVSLHRLRILNTLIDGIVRRAEASSDIYHNPEKTSEASRQAMINQYASQLHRALNATPYGVSLSGYSRGALVNALA